jgi:tetratricopeptide (TPR) repeat protein
VRSLDGEPPFIGRDAELEVIDDALRERRAIIVHGAPGLGKTRLAREYAHRHATGYPGGRYFVAFDQPPPLDLATLLRDTGKPVYPDDSIEDRCRRALRELGAAGRVLVIYDGVADERTLRDWLPYDGLDWHLIATSTSGNWARSWSAIELGPLPDGAARALAAAILGDDAGAARLVAPIVARAAGLTIELCASAAAAYEQLRRGGTVEAVSADLDVQTASSFASAFALLSDDARLALQVASAFVTPRVSTALVGSVLDHSGWSEPRITAALDCLRDRKLVGGDRDAIEIHRLVAQFVTARAPLGRPERRWLFSRLVVAARALARDPTDLDHRAVVMAHSLALPDWDDVVHDGRDAHALGKVLGRLGRFADAVPWFERALALKQQRAGDQRRDSETIGASLHQLGYCLSHLGRFEDALTWFERAVAIKQRGDPVDAASLGTSLHQVGHCHAQLGRFQDALVWFERAAAAAETADRDGRIDAALLGASLHRIGLHHQNLGRYGDALSWFERAIEAHQRGDRQARVDLARLADSLLHLGECHVQLGRFAEALPCLERGVGAAQHGDAHGRLDHNSLGDHLLWLGLCCRGLGRHGDALIWCERSVTAKQQGDEHGRVDHASVGKSMGQLGMCYMNLQRFAEALPWLERAATAKQRGNIHGRVDASSVGRSLYRVASCLVRCGRDAEALTWFERASAAAQHGDARGRVDVKNLLRSLQSSARCCERLSRLDDARVLWQRAARVARPDEPVAGHRSAPVRDDDPPS